MMYRAFVVAAALAAPAGAFAQDTDDQILPSEHGFTDDPPASEEAPWWEQEGSLENAEASFQPASFQPAVVRSNPEPVPDADVETRESDTPSEEAPWQLEFSPTLLIVGGLSYNHRPPRTETDERQDRFTTLALSRIGVRATYGPHFEVESEIELNAGPYGTSVWEGQAALQVRNQLLRIRYEGFTAELGRVTDDTSLNFFSAHIANTALTDPFTRFPLLVAGFNRGNGVILKYEPIEGLRAGLTVNAGNPTSTTGTVMVGGSFPPFERFYQVPWADVGRDARGFPTESFQSIVVAPSLSLETEYLRAVASFQYFTVDTNTNTRSDEAITGYNLRGGIQGRFLNDRLRPFLNLTRVVNTTVDEMDLGQLSGEYYMAVTGTAGIDFDIFGRSGIGAQYAVVYENGREATPKLISHFFNIGASWWFLPQASLDARYGLAVSCQDDRGGSGFDCTSDAREEEHVFYLTAKAVLGAGASQSGRRP